MTPGLPEAFQAPAAIRLRSGGSRRRQRRRHPPAFPRVSNAAACGAPSCVAAYGAHFIAVADGACRCARLFVLRRLPYTDVIRQTRPCKCRQWRVVRSAPIYFFAGRRDHVSSIVVLVGYLHLDA